MRWDKWLQGLIAAFVTGASTGFTVYAVSPDVFNLSDMAGLKKLGTVVVFQALVNFFLYLKQHPVPGIDAQAVPTKSVP